MYKNHQHAIGILYFSTALCLTACQAPLVTGPWGETAVGYRGRSGQQISHTCPSNGILGAAYGTDIYTDDSSICTAAVHAGLITPTTGGTVTIEIQPGQQSYAGTHRNNVTSESWGEWVGSFVFAGSHSVATVSQTPASAVGLWSATATMYRGQNGQRFTHDCPGNGTFKTAYGTDIYTDDSSICTAAVHAGLIMPTTGGTVTIEIQPGRRSYAGTHRNGVTSKDWGAWKGSFAFAGSPAVATMPRTSPSAAFPGIIISDVDRLPPVKINQKKNAYAVVIGIEQYREKLPKADFADRDAKLVGEYLTKVMGYPEENVVVRTNDKASLTDLIKYFENWLPNNVEKDSSVFVYYSGHGAPNPKTGDAFLVPYDGDPTFVDATGYPMKRLYAALDKLSVKDVTVVLDSCFSGAGGRSVLAKGAKPMGLSVEHALTASGKTMVLAASAGDQISSSYEEKGHGLLTYFFLKGLQGEGDANKDGAIDMAELYEYVKPNVLKVARKQYNNEQTPQLLANQDLLKRGGTRLIERTAP